ncbi:unnamed protein product [Taenia asiatica]|uniref:Transmembrane protein n=1 Tax=Taenia asiatica TaxID=60517 RepID=A0A158R751_TAEAS|nr:unnamed protein product [Taenia asiatica]
MEDIEFEEFVHVRPKPGLSLNVSRRVPSLANQGCQNLQKMFRRRISKALNTRDVAELTCAVVLVAVTADILYTLCLRKRKTTEEQRGFLNTSVRSDSLGNVIASFMVQITWPTSILEAVRNAELYGIDGSKFVPANSALIHTIFVLLLLEFRTKAPGAQTIAQFVGHRFGLVAHILATIIGLLTSLYTLTVNITKGSMVLSAVTESVSKTAILSLVLFQVGALLVVARRRSCGFILRAILTSILLICAALIFTVLNLSDSPAFGKMGSLYKLLMCYNRSDHGLGDALASGFDAALLSDGLISLVRKTYGVCDPDTSVWKEWNPDHFHCDSSAPRDLFHVQHRRRFIYPVSRCARDVHTGTSAELDIKHDSHCPADYAEIVSKVCMIHHRIVVQHKVNWPASGH